jgi:hypothetical protein
MRLFNIYSTLTVTVNVFYLILKYSDSNYVFFDIYITLTVTLWYLFNIYSTPTVTVYAVYLIFTVH